MINIFDVFQGGFRFYLILYEGIRYAAFGCCRVSGMVTSTSVEEQGGLRSAGEFSLSSQTARDTSPVLISRNCVCLHMCVCVCVSMLNCTHLQKEEKCFFL